ncbi:LuxR C-terminal-related transcriptional regulator [Streptomyces sp. NBC_01789]|uniref:ATP-binding protein n=1 Tax=Streptomyces sp. NBC_01789 TaxID=2975941 RepID=UPI0022564C5F|nr:LuxR C-terminal-related transcriptional regulator [Streptomyces sp. NBC_01789]MCX4447950.1 LuxR C-terminal-related transcriptional regulator [Streptomyces sp. NBC_01789]
MSVTLGPATEPVGRERESAALRERLLSPGVRLVTLTGRAGVGKTRLAREAVRDLGEAFARVESVDAAVPGALSAAVTAWREGAADGRTTGGHERLLLLLDGCDHEAREPAAEAAVTLAANPGVVVLATAVEPLGVYGEQLLPLGPLPVPGEGDGEDPHAVASVALFVRRARDADPSFALTLENGAAVAEICTLLGGLPLALELAALRLRLLPPHLLAARLRGRTTVLAGGPVNAPARHRSLTALAEWSCHGLDPAARALLGRLAVYEPGFGLAAAGLAEEEGLEPLMDRGLLTVVGEERGELRFAVPEPVRSHARTGAAEGAAETAADAHAERYRRLVAAALPGLAGTGQDRLLREAAAESPNVLAALRHLHERGDGEAAAAMVLGCHLPWLAQGRLREGLEWCDAVADAGPLPEAPRARLADLSGVFALALGDPQEAVRRHRRALALGKSVGDRRQNALASLRLGAALLRSGDAAAAHSVLVTAHSALSTMGVTGGTAEAAVALAAALHAEGDRRKARDMLVRAEETFRRSRDGRGLAGALRALAALDLEGDEPEPAETALREALRLYEAIDERTELPGLLEEFALLLLRSQPAQRPRAVRLLAAADVLRQRTGAEVLQEWRSQAERARTELGARLDWPDFATAWAEGVRMSAPTAVAEALSSPAPSRRTAAGAAAEAQSLTPRQAQVALLVAEGLTNRHIAARLDISEWTVVNHVRQVMRRLGCTSRVQVAGAVGRWG